MNIVLYSLYSTIEKIDEAKLQLFCCENKSMENLPPTADGLSAYTRRGSVWTTSEISLQIRPTPESWGWTWDECNKKNGGCKSEIGCGELDAAAKKS